MYVAKEEQGLTPVGIGMLACIKVRLGLREDGGECTGVVDIPDGATNELCAQSNGMGDLEQTQAP